MAYIHSGNVVQTLLYASRRNIGSTSNDNILISAQYPDLAIFINRRRIPSHYPPPILILVEGIVLHIKISPYHLRPTCMQFSLLSHFQRYLQAWSTNLNFHPRSGCPNREELILVQIHIFPNMGRKRGGILRHPPTNTNILNIQRIPTEVDNVRKYRLSS